MVSGDVTFQLNKKRANASPSKDSESFQVVPTDIGLQEAFDRHVSEEIQALLPVRCQQKCAQKCVLTFRISVKTWTNRFFSIQCIN
jgi:hypothetical protein